MSNQENIIRSISSPIQPQSIGAQQRKPPQSGPSSSSSTNQPQRLASKSSFREPPAPNQNSNTSVNSSSGSVASPQPPRKQPIGANPTPNGPNPTPFRATPVGASPLQPANNSPHQTHAHSNNQPTSNVPVKRTGSGPTAAADPDHDSQIKLQESLLKQQEAQLKQQSDKIRANEKALKDQADKIDANSNLIAEQEGILQRLRAQVSDFTEKLAGVEAKHKAAQASLEEAQAKSEQAANTAEPAPKAYKPPVEGKSASPPVAPKENKPAPAPVVPPQKSASLKRSDPPNKQAMAAIAMEAQKQKIGSSQENVNDSPPVKPATSQPPAASQQAAAQPQAAAQQQPSPAINSSRNGSFRSTPVEAAKEKSTAKTVEQMECYFGPIDRKQAEELLASSGSNVYLFRDSSIKGAYALSYLSSIRGFNHTLVLIAPGGYKLQDMPEVYSTISELISKDAELSGFTPLTKAKKAKPLFRIQIPDAKIVASIPADSNISVIDLIKALLTKTNVKVDTEDYEALIIILHQVYPPCSDT
eukprot:TRINITY_DN3945_c0_g1_i4.p1 TRINITY_DN3945_c0_g1~~TRINITY_DN3945_c0_g1_i4.p1  ORF type:complete len:530 (-),score=156.20 TRINITY_DN3945_c0_g1_i4:67-1656(-)